MFWDQTQIRLGTKCHYSLSHLNFLLPTPVGWRCPKDAGKGRSTPSLSRTYSHSCFPQTTPIVMPRSERSIGAAPKVLSVHAVYRQKGSTECWDICRFVDYMCTTATLECKTIPLKLEWAAGFLPCPLYSVLYP